MIKAIKQKENEVDVFFIVTEQPEVITSPNTALGGAASVNEQLTKITDGMNQLLNIVTSTCNKVETKISEINKGKDAKTMLSELTLEFGLTLTAEAGVVFTKASGEATLKVTANFNFNKSDLHETK
jgi:hypothetical protein